MKLTESRMGFFAQIGQEVIDFAEQYCLAKYEQSGTIYISGFDLYSIHFKVEWTTGCRGCYDDHSMDFSIPHEAFCEDSWRETLQKEIDAAKEKEKERQRLSAEAAIRRITQQEEQEYLRLKQKFEK